MTSAGPVQGGQSQSVQLKQQQLQQQQAIVAHQQAQLQSSQTQLEPEAQGQQPTQIEQIKMHALSDLIVMYEGSMGCGHRHWARMPGIVYVLAPLSVSVWPSFELPPGTNSCHHPLLTIRLIGQWHGFLQLHALALNIHVSDC
ncbi:hypothetical protein DPMN_064253 [Dreissena polymorpha]|uniref:Uncharacterized protein n=1 Tax=Dreissena polymorpha TaxID=45954 RepID=A0A9D4CBY4_DREPO|nr:hypothetical protein DPMN_064253 [Dreissena polymorpha]